MADILIIDDEENLSYSVQLALKRNGHACRIAENGEVGLAECARQLPDLALVDIHLPDINGLDLMARMSERGFDIPVVVITAYGTVDSAVAAMKRGAFDYLQKPLVMEEVCLTVGRCLENRELRNQLDAYKQAQQRESSHLNLISECPKMRKVIELADRIAGASGDGDQELLTLLLLGETGTGKEVLARYIHHRGQRADCPFVHVNCTAVPESLFESELFGHEPGAFTNAKSAKKGLLEMANEGTLFLDEIGDMPLATQAKLLVAIESGRFRRLGSTTERVARVQVMAATNTDLQAKADRGEFRVDLFYRLNVFCIELPPLRDRGDDIIQLAEHFIDRFSRKYRKPALRLSHDARSLILNNAWPGNVRELANVLRRAVLVTDTDTLEAATLGLDVPGPQRQAVSRAATQLDLEGGDWTLSSIEKHVIQAALQRTDKNISETARLLGLTRGGLRHRMEKLGL
ncbi:MAG: sigma-54-dependent Fis family transcriptional regulator [Phycisphaerae bacterium]|nr:sigma-54-dependent Fis family transcriptional regulator [Phycisphaerae bacterium]